MLWSEHAFKDSKTFLSVSNILSSKAVLVLTKSDKVSVLIPSETRDAIRSDELSRRLWCHASKVNRDIRRSRAVATTLDDILHQSVKGGISALQTITLEIL